jgi:hypothetical protein
VGKPIKSERKAGGNINLRGVAQLGPVCRVGHTIGTTGFSRAGLEPLCEGWKARLVRKRKAGGGSDLRGVAQLVARLVRDQEVRGSSPRTPIFKLGDVHHCDRFVLGVGGSRSLHLPRDPGPVRPVVNVPFGAGRCSRRAKRVPLAHGTHRHPRPRTPIFKGIDA